MNSPDPTAQSRARRALVELRYLSELRLLPRAVGRFYWRARRLAWSSSDSFSLTSSTRPKDLAILLSLAAQSMTVVELGSATGWTAIALALADPARRVVSYDPVVHPQRARYLELARADVSERIEFITAPGASGPPPGVTADLLYIDSSHTYEDTVAELAAWLPVIRAGGLAVFDDYQHPHFPGVRAAVEEAGLSGRMQGTLFVHRIPGG